MDGGDYVHRLASKVRYASLREKRKVAIIIDNCPAHPDVKLRAIKLIFLTRNSFNTKKYFGPHGFVLNDFHCIYMYIVCI